VAQVLDYIGRPGALAIIRAGYVGAVRYCGFPGRAKCTDASEFEDFSRNALGMALVYEDNTSDWRGGREAGRIAGARARVDATNRIKFPTWRPIYMAIDADVVGPAQLTTALSYLDGAALELGGAELTGVYGEHDIVKAALEGGHARYGWQTAAWSKGARYDGAHLYQHVGYVYPGGVQADVNDVLQPDWGQHNAESDVISKEDIAAIAAAVWEQRLPFSAPDGSQNNYRASDLALWTNYFANLVPTVNAALGAISASVATGQLQPEQVLARVDTAVRTATNDAIAHTVLPLLHDVVLEVLGEDNTDQARQVVDALGARLAAATTPSQGITTAGATGGQIGPHNPEPDSVPAVLSEGGWLASDVPDEQPGVSS